uniref:Uncharacterized protein n=1 Tax=Cannabis sativa TaxID=3483 RepID=A0A803PHI7_CANSA
MERMMARLQEKFGDLEEDYEEDSLLELVNRNNRENPSNAKTSSPAKDKGKAKWDNTLMTVGPPWTSEGILTLSTKKLRPRGNDLRNHLSHKARGCDIADSDKKAGGANCCANQTCRKQSGARLDSKDEDPKLCIK